jgi:hypothetical protein
MYLALEGDEIHQPLIFFFCHSLLNEWYEIAKLQFAVMHENHLMVLLQME